MELKNMKKLSLAISCFIPLYLILAVKNIIALCDAISKRCCYNIVFNSVVTGVWIVASIIGAIGLTMFICDFLSAKKAAKKKAMILEAENVTNQYYFTYFSLFVLSFFSIDTTQLLDLCVLIFLIVLLVIVYVKNDMYFINPVLNILGYKCFFVTVKFEGEEESKKPHVYKTFSTDNLSKQIDTECYFKYGEDDFTVCEKIK